MTVSGMYLQTWLHSFYPERPDLVAELQSIAAELQGHLERPRLGWKYACMTAIFGWKSAKRAQRVFSQMRSALTMYLDEWMYRFEKRRSQARSVVDTINPSPKN